MSCRIVLLTLGALTLSGCSIHNHVSYLYFPAIDDEYAELHLPDPFQDKTRPETSSPNAETIDIIRHNQKTIIKTMQAIHKDWKAGPASKRTFDQELVASHRSPNLIGTLKEHPMYLIGILLACALILFVPIMIIYRLLSKKENKE